MYLLIVILLILLLVGAVPHAPWYGPTGASWGYGPSGILGLVLVIVLVLALLGRL